MLHPVRRIVTGHDAEGRSIVISDAPATNLVTTPTNPNRGLINLWRTAQSPASNADGPDPMVGPPVGLLPPRDGTVFRFFQVAPEADTQKMTPEEQARWAKEVFSAAGAEAVLVDTTRHAMMHKTETVDYIILLSGQVTLVLEAGEVEMRPFDVVVQRGTNHAWVNHGDTPALLVAVLVDAVPRG